MLALGGQAGSVEPAAPWGTSGVGSGGSDTGVAGEAVCAAVGAAGSSVRSTGGGLELSASPTTSSIRSEMDCSASGSSW